MTTTRRGTFDGHIAETDYAQFKNGSLSQALEKSSHIPGFFYTSPEIYALEKEKIFMRDWLPVARIEEFEKPGSYKATTLFEEPYILLKNQQNEIKAYLNRCAHRGVAVTEGEGTLKGFVCPYHGWSYDLNGRLIHAPNMEASLGFDKEMNGLTALHVGIWSGWIFITFSDNPVPFDDFIAPYEQQLGFLHQDKCKLASKIVREVGCNWKFPVENLMDNYHSRILHAKTIGPTLSVERFTGAGRTGASFTAFYDAKPMTSDGISRFGNMPWLPDRSDRFACSAHIAPYMHLFARVDNVHPFLMIPLSVDRVRIEVYQLFPEEWHDQPGFQDKVKDYDDFTLRLIKEDISVMESLHDAASSRLFRPGRMSEFERGVWNVINYNLDRVLDTGPEQLYPLEAETADV